ncbi:MAG: hypothetical protein K6A38_03895 [Lachnospiraceae bacterium]|nr:hypothetical protein [Lachnospiraceae bacterium]
MKKIIKGIILGLIVIACAGASFFVGTKINSKTEGRGYNTPEEAIQAFAEGFANKDVEAKLSACAVESLVDHYDLEKFIEIRGSYLSGAMWCPGTGSDRTSQQLNIYKREYELISGFRNMFEYAASSDEEDFKDSQDIYSTKDMSTTDIMKKLAYIDDVLMGQLEQQEELYNADDMDMLAIELDIDGEEFILFADLVKYGNRWYVFGTAHSLGAAMQSLFAEGGLVRKNRLSD